MQQRQGYLVASKWGQSSVKYITKLYKQWEFRKPVQQGWLTSQIPMIL